MSAEPTGERHAMTAAELFSLPDDGRPRELVEGELHEMSPTGVRHGIVAMAVGDHLRAFVREHRLGYVTGSEAGFVLRRAPDTVRAPDVAYLPREGVGDPRSATGYGQTLPALVVEVVSPTDSASRVTRKALDWLAAGVRVVWVVDPEVEAVTVYGPEGVGRLLGPDEALDGGDILPGLTLPLATIFEDLH